MRLRYFQTSTYVLNFRLIERRDIQELWMQREYRDLFHIRTVVTYVYEKSVLLFWSRDLP